MRLAIVTGFTLFRVFAAAIIVMLWPHQAWTAIFLLMVIGFTTDLFDGLLARRWHVVSRFGKIADPLADKVICLTVLWLVASYYNSWLLLLGTGVITIYDISTMALRFTTTRAAQPVAGASLIAKIKTIVLMASLSLLLLSILAGGGLLFGSGLTLLIIACALSVWSLRQYVGQVVSAKREPEL